MFADWYVTDRIKMSFPDNRYPSEQSILHPLPQETWALYALLPMSLAIWRVWFPNMMTDGVIQRAGHANIPNNPSWRKGEQCNQSQIQWPAIPPFSFWTVIVNIPAATVIVSPYWTAWLCYVWWLSRIRFTTHYEFISYFMIISPW